MKGAPLSSSLQWGRDLSAAEGHACRKPVGTWEKFQWGRDLSAAEGGAGNVGNGPKGYASMGPRPLGRGRQRIEDIVDVALTLQWGRDLSAAEGLKPCPLRQGAQCFNGAATSRPRKGGTPNSAAGRPAGFNGAATSRPRKDAGHRVELGRVPVASMGPRPLGRGR